MNASAATKLSGSWEVRRKIKIPGLVHEADAMALEYKVGSLPGIRRVSADVARHRLILCYDVTVTEYRYIAEMLDKIGFPPQNNWFCRRKQAWYEFIEANARDSAKAPPSACCNKPLK